MATFNIYPSHTANNLKNPDNTAQQSTNYPDTGIVNISSSFSAQYKGWFLLKIDLSNYKNLSSAILKIKVYSVTNQSATPVVAYKISRNDWAWNESTYYVYKNGFNWTTNGGDYVTSNPSGGLISSVPSVGNFMSIDITAIAQDAIQNKNGIVDVIVFNNYTGSQLRDLVVYGIGDSNVSNKPYLEIQADYSPIDTSKMLLMF